jgi:beta-mannosidase
MWHRSAFASWTYNEPWPNAAHGCMVEYYGKPKMAYYYVKKSCSQVDISCVYDDIECRPDKPLDLEIWVSNVTSLSLKDSRYRWRIFNTAGELLWEEEKIIDINALGSDIAGKIRWRPSPGMDGEVALVYVELMNSADSIMSNHLYTFGIRDNVMQKHEKQAPKPLLKGLLEALPAKLEITATDMEKTDKGNLKAILEIRNTGENNGLFIQLDAETKDHYGVYFDNNYFFLPRGDSRKVKVEIVPAVTDIVVEQIVFSARAWNSGKETVAVKKK